MGYAFLIRPQFVSGANLLKGDKTVTKNRTLYLTYTALLTALAIILSYFPEIPLAFFAPWLKLDFSFTPMLLAGFALGPVAGLITLSLTNLAHLLGSTTAGVGELANMIVGASYLLPAMLLYRANKTQKNALIGMGIGIVLMTIAGIFSNMYILMPFFFGERLAEFDMANYVATGVIPFNLVKGGVNSLIVYVLYKRLSRLLKEVENSFARKH